MRLTKLLVILYIFGNCFRVAAQTTTEIILPDSNLVFKNKNIEGVIFGNNFKIVKHSRTDSTKIIVHDPLKLISKDENAKRFVPKIETTLQIEFELKSFIQDKDSFISDSLHFYVKQYFGYITSIGDTIVYINCFLNDEIKQESTWKNSLVRVMDGWHYYFDVKYNLTRKSFFDLWINGFG